MVDRFIHRTLIELVDDEDSNPEKARFARGRHRFMIDNKRSTEMTWNSIAEVKEDLDSQDVKYYWTKHHRYSFSP